MRQRNVMTRAHSYEDDVVTTERTMPRIGLAPMPQLALKHRPVRKPLKRVAPKPEELEGDDGEPKSWLYHRLDRAFAQVRMMMDGKMPETSIDDLIEELRVEEQKLKQEDELQNSTL